MTHNAPFSHISYQHPDGTNGVLDNHDADALHDAAGSVDAENLAAGAVTNGKIAAGAVTTAELADGAVTSDKLSDDVWDSISQCPYPVGALYLSFVSTSPADLWPNTTWQQISGRFLRMANDTEVGGADSYRLSAAQLPSHTHQLQYHIYYRQQGGAKAIGELGYVAGADTPVQAANTLATGSGVAINNMPAYQDVYAWQRLS